MNTQDILKYGHYLVVGAVDGLDESDWHTKGVCGIWSVKDIIAHLASYEGMLIEVFNMVIDSAPPGPFLMAMAQGPQAFNDAMVAERQAHSVDTILKEYTSSYERTHTLVSQIPADQQDQEGLLPWYGAEYDLQDFIVYTFYGHKREHCAQIAVFRDSLKLASES